MQDSPLFNEDYLRVLTPVTVNGIVPFMVNGVPQYKESMLPITAKRYLEQKNAKRPEHLKHIIDVIPNGGAKSSRKKRTVGVSRYTVTDQAKALAASAGFTDDDVDEFKQFMEAKKAGKLPGSLSEIIEMSEQGGEKESEQSQQKKEEPKKEPKSQGRAN